MTPSRVETLFARLAVHYGDDWARKWAGLPASAVLAEWNSELRGFSDAKIEHALRHLPERPPNVTQFRGLCAGAPEVFLALPEPKPSEEQKARRRSLLADLRHRLALQKVA